MATVPTQLVEPLRRIRSSALVNRVVRHDAVRKLRSHRVVEKLRARLGYSAWDYPADYVGPRTIPLKSRAQVRGGDFAKLDVSHLAWLDRPDWPEAVAKLADPVRKAAAESFARDGFFVAQNLLDHETVDRAFGAFLQARADGVVSGEGADRRILNPHHHIPTLDTLFVSNPLILDWLQFFFGRRPVTHQSTAGEYGTEIPPHTDAIHVSSFPTGFVIGAWIACEDIRLESGPIVYYPGSHRLPYVLSGDVAIAEVERERCYEQYNQRYFPKMRQVLDDSKIIGTPFLAKKGDVVFWHHNMLHSGAPITDPTATRKAVVCHFYAEGTLRFHDLTGSRSAVWHLPGAKQ
jgi:hypothetical protein